MKLNLAAALLLIGCAPVPPAEPPQAPPPAGPGAERACVAEGLGDLLGRGASTELGSEAMRRSGAGALRWIRPGDAVTMDYREDRLNVHLDERGRVQRFECG